MSRKSKRRRSRHGDAPPPASGAADFEFLDDRGNPRDDEYVPAAAAAAAVAASGATAVDTAVAEDPSTPRPSPTPARGTAAPAVTPPQPVAAAPAAPPEPPAEPVATLGEILTAARQARGLSIEEASARTRISAKMLQHLENDRFSEFAAEAYVRGFLRSYGHLLRLDVAMLLARYEALFGRPAPAEKEDWTPEVEPATAPVRTPKPNRRNTIAGIVIGTVAALTAVGMVLSERGVFELRPSAGLQQIEDELRAQQSATAAKPAATAPTPAAAANPEPAASPSSNAGSDAATNPTSDAASNPIVTPPVNAPAFGPTAAVSTTPTREDSAPAPPVVPPSATVAASAPGGDVALIESLVLTVTARDTCTLRLQIDSDARHAQRYAFTQVGETRSWSAKQSFRVVARTGSSLDMWLNGMPVRIPTDGRTIVFDRATLRGDTTPVVAPPKKVRRTSRRKSRPAQTTRPAPAPAVPDPVPQNAAGPP